MEFLRSRGLDQLSPPEVESTLLELPAERASYVALLGDLTGWPDRTPLQRRVPSDAEVQQLNKARGRWRAVTLLDDDAAIRAAALLFRRVFILDPLYDSADMLYAAWHDPVVRSEHARRLAEQSALMVRAAPLLRDGTAILAPDHLPGSWDPRPGWRPPRADAEDHIHRAWALRTALVMLNWADRLDAVAVVTRADVVEQVPVALGPRLQQRAVLLAEPPALAESVQLRTAPLALELWAHARRAARGRSIERLPEVARALKQVAGLLPAQATSQWQLLLGGPNLADPALLLRRVLNGTDPYRQPDLPPAPLRRRPLCLIMAAPPAD